MPRSNSQPSLLPLQSTLQPAMEIPCLSYQPHCLLRQPLDAIPDHSERESHPFLTPRAPQWSGPTPAMPPARNHRVAPPRPLAHRQRPCPGLPLKISSHRPARHRLPLAAQAPPHPSAPRQHQPANPPAQAHPAAGLVPAPNVLHGRRLR